MRVPKFGSDSAKTAGPPDADDGTPGKTCREFLSGYGARDGGVSCGAKFR